jgi:hypothetical protein
VGEGTVCEFVVAVDLMLNKWINRFRGSTLLVISIKDVPANICIHCLNGLL